MGFEIVNEHEIPPDLPRGRYNTRVESMDWEDGVPVVRVRFLGTPYADHSCLIPLIRE